MYDHRSGRRRLRVLAAAVLTAAATLAGLTVANGPAEASGFPPPERINNWSCEPAPEHPEPVVLVHGMGANGVVNWLTMAPAIAGQGYCVFTPTYGAGVLGTLAGGLQPMRKSAAELSDYIDKVLDKTGAEKVDIVGHSEGSTVPAYYLKHLGGADKVKHFVGFGANYRGTTLSGLNVIAKELLKLPGIGDLVKAGCGPCDEYLPPSSFLDELAEGGISVPGPTYTSIVSKGDEVVTPYTSGVLGEPGTTDIVLQDKCPSDHVGHLGQAVDPNVLAHVLKALDPEHAPSPKCTPFFLPL